MHTSGQVHAPAALPSGKNQFFDRRGGRVSLRCDLYNLEMTKTSCYFRDGQFNVATWLRAGRFGVPNNVNSNKWTNVFKYVRQYPQRIMDAPSLAKRGDVSSFPSNFAKWGTVFFNLACSAGTYRL
jgi:hypothetical protein